MCKIQLERRSGASIRDNTVHLFLGQKVESHCPAHPYKTMAWNHLPQCIHPRRLTGSSLRGPPWSKTAKNTDCSTGPLARPFARSLAPLTRLLAPNCLLRSRPPLRSLVRSLAHSLTRGKVNYRCLKMTWFCPKVDWLFIVRSEKNICMTLNSLKELEIREKREQKCLFLPLFPFLLPFSPEQANFAWWGNFPCLCLFRSVFPSFRPSYFLSIHISWSPTILAIFKSTLWHYSNLLVKNIQDDTKMLLIICGPTTGVHHGLYTRCHWGVKRFQDLRSDPVWDLLGDQSPACNWHFPCAIFSWP